MDINGTIQDCISPAVEAAELSGAVTLVWNQGEVVHAGCSGCRSVEAQSPMERTTLFRIASMTKPITSVAALQAMEDGRFQLSDSITRWVPEFSDMRVLRSCVRQCVQFGDQVFG